MTRARRLAPAIFLADCLRATTRRLGNGMKGDLDNSTMLHNELDIRLLNTVWYTGERFTRLRPDTRRKRPRCTA